MRQKIKNNLYVEVDGVDLTECTNIEFYVKQDGLFFQYTPYVHEFGVMTVTIPYKDAMKLKKTSVKVQFAFTDANGNPDASEVKELTVATLLKEAGYDPV